MIGLNQERLYFVGGDIFPGLNSIYPGSLLRDLACSGDVMLLLHQMIPAEERTLRSNDG